MDTSLLGGKLTLPLTVLGLIGLTSFLGIKEKGGIKPGQNQTLVVSGAAGACAMWLCGWTGGVVISASLIKSQIPVLKQTLK